MSLTYAYEKLVNAVSTLATGTGSLQERVVDAYQSSAMHIEPDEDLPEDLRLSFVAIKHAMTSGEPVGEEGIIQASGDHMSDEVARVVAQDIVNLGFAVARARAELEHPF